MTNEIAKLAKVEIEETETPEVPMFPRVYGWVIERDKVNEGESDNVVGPSHTDLTADAIRHHPNRKVFRLLDDDREEYFRGLIVEDENTSGFEPLDDFGEAFGCTSIQYLNNGVWDTL